MAVASLQPIYERLNGADGYHPFAANTFSDWAIEAGDIVTLKRGTDSYASPVHTSHLSWRGSPQVSMQTRGNKQLDSIGKATQKKFSRGGGAYRAAQSIGKKSSVYFQKPDPQLSSELNINDVWIESDMLNSWEDVGELTWEELAEYTWMDFYGSKMYAWDGTNWVQISDEQKENYNFDLLRNTTQELTSIKADLSGAYSLIQQTKSEIHTQVVDTKNGLQSSISQTAGQIRSEVSDSVNNLQSSITQNANKISLVVEGTGANAHIKPASIVAAINAQTGQSAVKISADMIVLDGDAVATSLTGKDISANELGCDTMGVGSDLYFDANVTLHSAYGDSHDCENMIVKAEVSGNTLTLTPLTGSAITFSKATALSTAWSGSVLTMKAQQTNGGTTTDVATNTIGLGGSDYGTHTIDLAMTQNGTPTISSGTNILVPVKIVQKQGGGATTDRANTNLQYSVSSLLTTGSYNTGGTKTPGSGYIGFSSVTFTIPNASGFTKNDPNYNTANSNQVAAISKSGLTANTYMYWTVGGKKYHIVVNA